MMHSNAYVDDSVVKMQLPQLDLNAPIEPRPQGCAVPLTAEQRHFFRDFVCADPEQQRPLSVRRMCACATRITGPLNLALLEACIAGVVQRHESLRTKFKTVGGITTQHIDSPGEYSLTCVDLSLLLKSEAEREAQRLAGVFQDQKVDLSTGPLFEAKLYRLATQDHVLIVLVDHMISDGISNVLLDREIWRSYDNAVGDEPASLPTPPVQFADYAVWQERIRESWRTAHEHYWKKHRLEGVPTTIPPSSETDECPGTGRVAHIKVGSVLTTQLRQVAEREQVSLSNVALTMYATSMSLWCAKTDLVIRYPVHGRHNRPELMSVVGFFSSYVCLRIEVRRSDSLLSLLGQVRDETRSALTHRDFDRMRELIPECVKTDLEFHWRSARLFGRSEPRRLHKSRPIMRHPFFVRSPTSGNFWCFFNETPSDVCITVHYRTPLFHPSSIDNFGNNMRTIAKALIERPLDPVDRLVLSSGR